LWPQDCPYLPLAIDATNIGDNFTILSINVLIRGSGIPVAGQVVIAFTEKASWQPLWKELFSSLKGMVPSEMMTIVSAVSGLYAPWLYQYSGQFLDPISTTTQGWQPKAPYFFQCLPQG